MLSLLLAVWMSNVPLVQTDGDFFPLAFDQPGEVKGHGQDMVYVPSYPGTTTGAFCALSDGMFQIDAHISMAPGPTDETGQFYWRSDFGPAHSKFLTSWHTHAGQFSDLNNATVVFEADRGECFELTYSSTGGAFINADPRATSLSVRKL